jgi:hypothetical protein
VAALATGKRQKTCDERKDYFIEKFPNCSRPIVEEYFADKNSFP